MESLLIVLTEDVLKEPQKIGEFIINEIHTNMIDKKTKLQLRKPTVRKEMYEKCKDAFLLVKSDQYPPYKFPVMSPYDVLNGKCEYHCGLIAAAYFRANEWREKDPEYVKVAEKAKKLFYDNGCDKKLKIRLHESGDILPLIDALDAIL